MNQKSKTKDRDDSQIFSSREGLDTVSYGTCQSKNYPEKQKP